MSPAEGTSKSTQTVRSGRIWVEFSTQSSMKGNMPCGHFPRLEAHPSFPRPLKYKFRYNTAVTVCIAAACLADGESCIALCSDTLLSQGSEGSNEFGFKLIPLSSNWGCLVSGPFDSANEWVRELKRFFNSTRLLIRRSEDAVKLVKRSLEYHKATTMYEAGCELLVTGFIAEEPIIVYAESACSTVSVTRSYRAIGEGGQIATIILNIRGCHPGLDSSMASYYLYEAKRFSESVASVGKGTVMALHRPAPEARGDQFAIKILSKTQVIGFQAVYDR